MGQITIPIYEGGAAYAATRQAKEQLGQQELQTDLQRDKVRAAVVAAWGANQNSLGVLRAAKSQVEASEVALAGVREEAKVGQRTTLDVLNAQQALLERARPIGDRPARSGRQFLHAAFRDRPPVDRTLWGWRSKNTIRGCISTKSRTSGSVWTRPTASDANVQAEANEARFRRQN